MKLRKGFCESDDESFQNRWKKMREVIFIYIMKLIYYLYNGKYIVYKEIYSIFVRVQYSNGEIVVAIDAGIYFSWLWEK